MFMVVQLTLSERFALVVEGLCRAVAARIAVDRAAGPLILLIRARLMRMTARFVALADGVRAGTYAAPRRRERRVADVTRPRAERLVPEGFGWLVRLVPKVRQFGGQVQHLLADPEMAALLAAAPRAGRVLRPLCRMMAIRPVPEMLRLPARAVSREGGVPRAVPGRAVRERGSGVRAGRRSRVRWGGAVGSGAGPP